MTPFQRLTWDDLGNLTRAELLPRLAAEQQYWARKARRGLSEDDQHARSEFGKILCAALSPPALADAMGEMAAWLKGERAANTSYWNEKPGHGPAVTSPASGPGHANASSAGPISPPGKEISR